MSKGEAGAFQLGGEHEHLLANPEHVAPVQIHCADPESMPLVVDGVEGALGVRLGCDLDEDGYPRTTFNASAWNPLFKAFKSLAQTHAGLYIAVSELDTVAPRAAYTLPIGIAGHRDKAVVGVYSYMLRMSTRGSRIRQLGRNVVGRLNTKAQNDYFEATDRIGSPQHIRDRGVSPYLRGGTLGSK